MLQSELKKQSSKADVQRKAEAWKTLNSVLIKSNAEFMEKLSKLLITKTEEQESLKKKLEEGQGTSEENAEYLFLGGYTQCLRDILNARQQ